MLQAILNLEGGLQSVSLDSKNELVGFVQELIQLIDQ